MPHFRLKTALISISAAVLLTVFVGPVKADPDFPVPSPYRLPGVFELSFTHGLPKRISVDVPGEQPKAYWYMTYTVTNDGNKEQLFYPKIDLLTADGKVAQSDQNIPQRVFDQIKIETRNRLLEPYTTTNGPIRLGPAEAHDAVAIWPETVSRMEHFSIFVTGLSGESVVYKRVDGKLTRVTEAKDLPKTDDPNATYKDLTIFRKTLQLNFFIRGDEVYPGEDEVNQAAEEWIMR
jgi:hypothetical protein